MSDNQKVRAKFFVQSIKPDGFGNQELLMSACTTEDGDGMDFTEYTPAGELRISINGDVPAAKFFELNDVVYLDFTKLPK